MMSSELERCCSCQLESTPKCSLSDSDSVELELLRVDALESEVCDLDRCLDLSTLRCGDWDLLGEYDGLRGVWCLGGANMQMKMCVQPERWMFRECWDPCHLHFGLSMASQTLCQLLSYALWIALPGLLHFEHWLVSLPQLQSLHPGWCGVVMCR